VLLEISIAIIGGGGKKKSPDTVRAYHQTPTYYHTHIFGALPNPMTLQDETGLFKTETNTCKISHDLIYLGTYLMWIKISFIYLFNF